MEDGEVLWEGRHIARSRAYGLPLSPIDLAKLVWSTLGNIGEEQVRRVTDDRLLIPLCRCTGGATPPTDPEG